MAMISTQLAQNIAQLERPAGRLLLAEALGWEPFDEEDDLKKGILLDFHYDNLMFCVQKGYPWQQVCVFVDMAAVILQESTGQSLAQAIKTYHDHCQACSRKVGDGNLKQFTDYFFETFMQHFRLYQCVLSQEREDTTVRTALSVDTPRDLPPFTQAKDVSLWEYEQRLRQVEAAEKGRKSEREAEREAHVQQLRDKVEEGISDLRSAEVPPEKEALVQMINDIASAHISATRHCLHGNITQTIEDLDFMLQKTSIPRPQELASLSDASTDEEEERSNSTVPPLPSTGNTSRAPPRYKTKTPLAASKRPKSSKDKPPNRDKSGKSRAQSRNTSKSTKNK